MYIESIQMEVKPMSAIFKKGMTPWNKGATGEQSHSFGRTFTKERKENISVAIKRYYDLKGRKSHKHELFRKSKEYKEWRIKVFERDNFKCTQCESIKDLHAHHLKSFSKYPHLRFKVDNGKTLCSECHGKIHRLDFNGKGRHLICEICKTSFRPKSGHLKQKTCSKKCGYELRTKHGSGKKGKIYPHLWKKPIKICPICNNEFRATVHKQRNQQYCSSDCYMVYWKENIKPKFKRNGKTNRKGGG